MREEGEKVDQKRLVKPVFAIFFPTILSGIGGKRRRKEGGKKGFFVSMEGIPC